MDLQVDLQDQMEELINESLRLRENLIPMVPLKLIQGQKSTSLFLVEILRPQALQQEEEMLAAMAGEAE